jgi:Polysaccharide lyase 14/S-layer homology domain
MRRIPAFVSLALVLALNASLLPLPAAAADGTWLQEDFDNGNRGVISSSGVQSVAAGHRGDGIRVDIPKGAHWGTTTHWNTRDRLGSDPEEMWIRYWLKFPTGFRVDSPSRGKLPGFGGLYTYNCLGGRPSTPSSPCWSARMAFSPLYAADGLPSRPVDPAKVTRISFYAYLLNSSDVGQDGKILHWDPDLATLDHNRWYCIEARVKMNTLGQQDGILEGYVDGVEAFKATNLKFRRASESQVKVKSLWFDVYYGGTATSPQRNEIFFDSLAAGPERIGCNDNSKSSGTFFDDDGSIFEADIEKLAASGITKGCNPPANDRFCPEDPVTRGQMAAFLRRAFVDRLGVTLPDLPPSPPDFWGAATETAYTSALQVYADGGAPLDTYVVTYPIDERGGNKDWLSNGATDNPNLWVPVQLENIWQRGATPYVRVTVSDLRALAGGSLDQRLGRMLDSFSTFVDGGGGRRLMVDILPEANNSSHPYGDDATRFKQAYGRVADRAHQVLGDGVRTVFTGLTEMRSGRYSQVTYGIGGYRLFWPGSDHVDVAGVGGFDDRAGSNVGFYATAVEEMVGAAGPGTPIIISSAGVPAVPSEAAQIDYVEALAQLVADHDQLLGVQWEDRRRGSADMRVSSSSGLQAGFAAASAGARTGGIDWLFSNSSKEWSSQRMAAIPFDDSTSSVFVDDIRWLASTGITKGCGPRRFCPLDPVTRGQMAAFMVRALDLPAPAQLITFDDSRGDTFEADISRLAGAGITKGCNPPSNTRFCPDDFVTRGQMAAFMVRAGLTD